MQSPARTAAMKTCKPRRLACHTARGLDCFFMVVVVPASGAGQASNSKACFASAVPVEAKSRGAWRGWQRARAVDAQRWRPAGYSVAINARTPACRSLP